MDCAARLRQLLAEERRRGAEFETAWERATSLALAETAARETWAEVLRWSRSAFRRAYEHRPRQVIDWLEPPGDDWHDTPADRVELVA